MLPNLKELHEKEERIRKKLADHQESLGVSQAFELGERSNAELVLFTQSYLLPTHERIIQAR